MFFSLPLVPSRLTVGPINFLPCINLPPPVSPPRLLLLNFPSIPAAYVGVRVCVFRVFAQCKHSCTRAQVGGEARRCGCLRGRVCASHAKLSPFSLSLYPFAFFFALCKINNSGLQTQRVEGENIHGGKNYSHALYLSIASRIVFQGAQSLQFLVGGKAQWCCMTHTHTHTQLSPVVCSP